MLSVQDQSARRAPGTPSCSSAMARPGSAPIRRRAARARRCRNAGGQRIHEHPVGRHLLDRWRTRDRPSTTEHRALRRHRRLQVRSRTSSRTCKALPHATGDPPSDRRLRQPAAITAAGGNTADFNTGPTPLNFGPFTVDRLGDTARNVSLRPGRRMRGSAPSAPARTPNPPRPSTARPTRNFASSSPRPGATSASRSSRFGDAFGERERVSFDFVIGGSTVRVTKMACRSRQRPRQLHAQSRRRFRRGVGRAPPNAVLQLRLDSHRRAPSRLALRRIRPAPPPAPSRAKTAPDVRAFARDSASKFRA